MHIADAGTDQMQLLVLERRDDARNMARWYVLSIEPTLFGDQALIREWGRTGSAGRRIGHPYASKAAAAEALDAWLARKLRRGYRVRAMEDKAGLRQAK